MSGFHRQQQPASPDRTRITASVTRFLAQDAAFENRVQDPFGVADPCLGNAGGHHFISSCGAVVCVHCERVVWR